jgi:dTDP-4-dehydrorhamnose reductase
VNILLTGANGQVGFEARRALSPLGRVHAVDRRTCDLADEVGLRRLVRDLKPDAIVNAAAYTAVDRAETEEALAHAVNARAPRILAEEAEALGALLVHYSTDYVFDGRKEGFHAESDPPNPLGVYGHSKLSGERGVQDACTRHLIFRTSWVFGTHGANFAKTMLRLAGEKPSLRVVADQIGAPTSAALIADVTALALARASNASFAAYGLYHLSAAGETSWHGYACHLIAQARRSGRGGLIADDEIRPITTADYPTPAMRPANSRLDTTKLRRAFGITLPDWREGVDALIRNLD